jgi:hypothetical protein
LSGHVFVSPDALLAAAAQLEAVAHRMQATLDASAPALHLSPAGTEEVSILTASHFNSIADSFLPSAATGIAELLGAAATLRKQAAEYEGQDHSFGTALAAGM